MPELAQSPSCQRFRVLTSLGLDTELSRFEVKLLAAHASRCVRCDAYAEEVEAITAQIRTSNAHALDHGFTASGRTSWRARSRPRKRGSLSAAALAMLLVVALGAGSSPGGHLRVSAPPVVTLVADTPSDELLLRALSAPSGVPGRTKVT